MKEQFESSDADCNAMLSPAEFALFLRSLKLQITDADIEQIMTETDTDGDGQIVRRGLSPPIIRHLYKCTGYYGIRDLCAVPSGGWVIDPVTSPFACLWLSLCVCVALDGGRAAHAPHPQQHLLHAAPRAARLVPSGG